MKVSQWEKNAYLYERYDANGNQRVSWVNPKRQIAYGYFKPFGWTTFPFKTLNPIDRTVTEHTTPDLPLTFTIYHN